MTETLAAVGEQPWEVRFTRRALAGLGADAARDTPAQALAEYQPDVATAV